MALVFEWDTRKAGIDYRKHRVSFAEASTVFDDPLAAIFADNGHSGHEVREIIIGYSSAGRVILVFFTERSRGRVRIFSARRATPRERMDYEEHIQE